VRISNSKPTLVAGTGEPTLFDSLARLVPKELQAAYYRVLAHTQTLSPDDEMLRILEAMGILALLTRHTPKEIAEERTRFQEVLVRYEQCSNDTQEKMLEYLNALDTRIATLPEEIEEVLNPGNLAKFLGESIRQQFLRSGLPKTAEALQACSATIAKAEADLGRALARLCDNHYGVLAEVESANRRVTYSLESRAKSIDALLFEVRHDILRLWVPILCGAALLIGLFGGMSIQSWRDNSSEGTSNAQPAAIQPTVHPAPKPETQAEGNQKIPPHNLHGAEHFKTASR